jgi:flagellar basal-body rod protein FlgC
MINLLSGVQATTAALQAERIRLDVIAQNIANANTTRGVDGKPYQRQQVVFEAVLTHALDPANPGVAPHVARIEKDSRPPTLIYNPGHQDADAHGMVALPNVSIHEEVADMIVATRAYDANLAVVKSSRTMALATLALGKH